MPKHTCSKCGCQTWSALDFRNLCKSCAGDTTVLAGLRVRCVDPAEDLTQVPNENGKRGIAKDLTSTPHIYVVEFGDNRQVAKKPKQVLWCADPTKLRIFMRAAKEMIQAAADGFNNADEKKIRWFGVETDSRKWSTISTKLNALNIYLKNELITVKFACTSGDGIAAIDKTKFNSSTTTVTVLLDRGFFWRRFSDGEMICSIIHEFTHIICDTTDERANGADQYGMTKCQKLAIDFPDQAWINADNWAYFITEFKDQVDAYAAIDWTYLDLTSFSDRSPLTRGMAPP